MRAAAASIVLTALVLVSCPGCGAGAGAQVGPTVPVKGRVTYQGKPLTQGTITFEPVDTGREANGNIGPDGTFVLTTFKEGDGAVAGVHRVGVVGTGKTVLPAKLRNPSSSTVEVEVSQGKTEYVVDLK
jgi:hypothetical protein